MSKPYRGKRNIRTGHTERKPVHTPPKPEAPPPGERVCPDCQGKGLTSSAVDGYQPETCSMCEGRGTV